MSSLFEIVITLTGESYCRCYAWCHDETEARSLFEFHNGSEYTIQSIKPLFCEQSGTFITQISDSGWETEADKLNPEEV